MNPPPHVLTALDLDRDTLSAEDLALVDDVERHGFRIARIEESAADAEDLPEWGDVPCWTYTIGLFVSTGHPEIVVFALGQDTASAVLWDIARGIQDGRRFEPGRVYDDALPSFDGARCAFEPVSPRWAESLFGFGRWFYAGESFPVLQYLWPDRNGRFAWDEQSTAELRAAQPSLIEPPETDDAPPPARG